MGDKQGKEAKKETGKTGTGNEKSMNYKKLFYSDNKLNGYILIGNVERIEQRNWDKEKIFKLSQYNTCNFVISAYSHWRSPCTCA